ncbi:DJ-1/PfpI/YhbO family deglycase/protease [Candidatus Pacearchaeota archaeon]|nr:DJ-1/PfpI/YhbO family deglycase/protease [Candidatus Pacearchaeota archaeon]
MKKALIITGQGFQDSEVIYPYYRLEEDEFSVDVAALKKEMLFGINGVKFEANTDFSEIKVDNYNLLVLPGGVKALEKIRQEQGVLDFIKEFSDKGKVIVSICHGAQLMISAKIVSGKKISGYYSIKDDIINAGATYVDAPYVIDGNIISSPHYKHSGPWMKAAIDLYYEKNQEIR